MKFAPHKTQIPFMLVISQIFDFASVSYLISTLSILGKSIEILRQYEKDTAKVDTFHKSCELLLFGVLWDTLQYL